MDLMISHVPVNHLKAAIYNPRKWDATQLDTLKESITRFGMVDPLIVNKATTRNGILIGGHMRLAAAKALGFTEVPVVYVDIAEEEKEKELNIRLNKNSGEFDYSLLAEFDEKFLSGIGFSSEELDDIFPNEEKDEAFDLEKELKSLDIKEVSVKAGDVYNLNGSRLMCGDSTLEADILKLMDGQKADMCFTDPPYILAYLKDKKGKGGFGSKQDRRYMGTDSLPDNFTELWMGNVSKVAKDDFHAIVYENWRNIRTIWDEMEKHWTVRNMIVWHLPNRSQGFPAQYRFFNKHDIAIVGTGATTTLNTEPEEELLENEYQTALHAISGKPQWEGYEGGKKICPTDFIEHQAANRRSSGQGIIFGTKPVEILIPYIKVLTRRDDLILEPFGGSGSTLIAATKMQRRCYLMEKSPTYAQVILKRWENETGLKAKKQNGTA